MFVKFTSITYIEIFHWHLLVSHILKFNTCSSCFQLCQILIDKNINNIGVVTANLAQLLKGG